MKRLILILLASCGAVYAQQNALLLPWTPQQFTNTNGTVLASGKVCSYLAGTSTGTATFTDATASVQNSIPPNAILLDSTGRPTSGGIWLTPNKAYKIVSMTAGSDSTCNTGVVIKTQDNITLGASTAASNTFTGTNTFSGPVVYSGATCTVASLQAAIAAIPAAGGTVDFRACTTVSTNITNATGSIAIPANVIVLLGPSTWTCTISTATTPCWWEKGDGAQIIGAGGGNTFGGGDPGVGVSTGVTTLLCSSCGTTTDMVLVENPNRSAAFPGYLINSARVQGISVNMGASGREGIFTVDSDDGTFTDFKIFQAVCTSAPCGALHIAAGLSSDPALGQSYRNNFSVFEVAAAPTNTTGASCFIDARFGEVAYGLGISNFRCSGNVTTGGGLVALLLQASTSSVIGSIDTLTFDSGYIGNPVAGATSYGVQMECPGNWLNHTNGVCFNLTFRNILLERIFASATGTAFGCTASGSSNGTGCGEIHMDNMSINFAHWATTLDNRTTNNPIGSYRITGTLGSQSGGNPEHVSTGTLFGNNAQAYRSEATWSPIANSQLGFGYSSVPNISKGANTGLSYLHYFADIGDGTYTGAGTLTSLLGYKCNGSFGSVHTVTAEQTNCFQEVGGDPNSFDGPFEFVETTAPAGLAGVDKLYADSTAHALKVNLNNTGFGPLVTAAPCTTSQRTETAADANLLTCAIPAQAGSYRIRLALTVSAANAATLGWTATWQAPSVASNPTNLALFQTGVAVPALTFTTSSQAIYYGMADIDVDNSATSIVVKLTFSGTSFTAKASATVERII